MARQNIAKYSFKVFKHSMTDNYNKQREKKKKKASVNNSWRKTAFFHEYSSLTSAYVLSRKFGGGTKKCWILQSAGLQRKLSDSFEKWSIMLFVVEHFVKENVTWV